MTRNRLAWKIAAAGMIACSTSARSAEAPASSGGNRYDRCLEQVKHDAARAEAESRAWAAQGGGAAALDCEALALAALRRFGQSAEALEAAAASAGAANAPLRAALLDQAGNAWLLADNPGRADAAFTSALALAPKNEDFLSDRARARGAAKNWTGAIEDLTSVLALDPDRADTYVLRASALHAQGKTGQAQADITHALAIYPGYPEALVERGTMRLESGDRSGARADWRQAESEAPDSDAGRAARARLEQFGGAPAAKRR